MAKAGRQGGRRRAAGRTVEQLNSSAILLLAAEQQRESSSRTVQRSRRGKAYQSSGSKMQAHQSDRGQTADSRHTRAVDNRWQANTPEQRATDGRHTRTADSRRRHTRAAENKRQVLTGDSAGSDSGTRPAGSDGEVGSERRRKDAMGDA